MIVTIKYCGQWDYTNEASSLEAAIREATTIEDVFLQEGANGIFDVLVDGNVIYSKDQTGEFPTNEEILDGIVMYDLGRPKCGI